MNWELTWNDETSQYIPEDASFTQLLNELLNELETISPPIDYHKHEDALAENVVKFLKWNISKVEKRWKGEDYDAILTQGGWHDKDFENLLLAAAGRINAAKIHNHLHFDDMENGHRKQLSSILTIILYHRSQNMK
ncbi:hypothetical protein [Pedobacter sp. KBS0701]|uniref:hypothetical protein n=1 Tax=Pedobacter sp. KBS0701 TaxID=2578106 RepID=UPI001AF01C1D|nr:hypothetical protein [Pedobacter sp. KBS0701]